MKFFAVLLAAVLLLEVSSAASFGENNISANLIAASGSGCSKSKKSSFCYSAKPKSLFLQNTMPFVTIQFVVIVVSWQNSFCFFFLF
jgi:hypothetical protein